MTKGMLLATAGVVALLAPAGAASALTYELADRNSTASIEVDTSAGLFSWVVDGVQHQFQHSFWFRINGTDTQEHNISVLTEGAGGVQDTIASSPGNDTMVQNYSNGAGLNVQYRTTLLGGNPGSNESGVQEQVFFDNQTGQSLSVSLFSYFDFDLGNTSDGDSAFPDAGNIISMYQSGDGFELQVDVSDAVAAQIANFADILTALNDTDIDNLSATTFAQLNAQSIASGDVTFAFQWDFIVAAGQSEGLNVQFDIRKAPEPVTLGLFGLGLLGAGLARRRKAA